MRINPVSTLFSSSKINKSWTYVQNPIASSNLANDTFVKAPQETVSSNPVKTLSFMGYKVYVVDGGHHADDMEHFANAIAEDMDVEMRRLENTPNHATHKPLQDVELQLRELNRYGATNQSTYVAVPVNMSVSLANLAEQYKKVMGSYLHLRPHTTKTCQEKLMNFLMVLYQNPDKYRKYIEYMDPENQGLEYAYGVIKEINNMKARGVYIPADQPLKKSLEWLASVRGETPELTNYLATGYDSDDKVKNMANYIKEEGWHDFNVLALANAHIVNLKKTDGADHIYSAFDTLLNDGQRGVYNLSPVRENGKLVGYSYTDSYKNEYPIEEFPHNEKVKDIAKFVGLSVDEAVADDWRTEEFKRALRENRDTSEFSDKLYPAWKVFNEDEMRANKIYLKGDFVDSKLEHYFRRNNDYKIVYPAADSENSGKPSVMGVRDASYAVLNAIKRDVANQNFYDSIKDDHNINLKHIVHDYVARAREFMQYRKIDKAQAEVESAMWYIDVLGFNPRNDDFMEAYRLLADIKYDNGEYDSAEKIYNFYLNNVCKNYLADGDDRTYADSKSQLTEIKSVFLRLANISKAKGEFLSEKFCRKASEVAGYRIDNGIEIVRRRANDDINIGDLIV